MGALWKALLAGLALPMKSSSSSSGSILPQPRTTVDETVGAYVHIPFCRRRCYYCNFAIQPIGDRASTQAQAAEHLVSLLEEEIDQFAELWTKKWSRDLPKLDTLYFGGGTPSLLPDTHVEKLLSKFLGTFGATSRPEITMEMDPGTFDLERLSRLKAVGINRVSAGIQAFHPTVLRDCGRAHTADDSLKALEALAKADLDSYSVDLIGGLPGLTAEHWQAGLRTVIDSGAPHVSVYDLQIEEGTAFGSWYGSPQDSTRTPLPSEALTIDMLTSASRDLRSAGYEHYEISSYAKPGHRSAHNTNYWRRLPTLAFGPSATSFLGGVRFTRPSSMATYERWIHAGGPDASILGQQGAAPDLQEVVMLSLRTIDGLNLQQVADAFGAEVRQRLESALRFFVEQRLVEREGPIVRLTDPRGVLLSNHVISSLFARLDILGYSVPTS